MALDLGSIAGFDWDDGNSRKSADKHGVSQAEAEQVFINTPLLVTEDMQHSAAEARYRALGRTGDNRMLHVTFTLRQDGTVIRVISARAMNRKERAIYEGANDEKKET
ncbi:MAG: BrnT family toxin [Pseudolabrys sp.]